MMPYLSCTSELFGLGPECRGEKKVSREVQESWDHGTRSEEGWEGMKE